MSYVRFFGFCYFYQQHKQQQQYHHVKCQSKGYSFISYIFFCFVTKLLLFCLGFCFFLTKLSVVCLLSFYVVAVSFFCLFSLFNVFLLNLLYCIFTYPSMGSNAIERGISNSSSMSTLPILPSKFVNSMVHLRVSVKYI